MEGPDPKLITYNNGFIIGQPDMNVENLVNCRRYASSLILNDCLWVIGGSSSENSDDFGSHSRLSSTEFINGWKDTPISGPDLNFTKIESQVFDGMFVSGHQLKLLDGAFSGIDQHCVVQYDESSIYLIGGWPGNSQYPTETTLIINPLENFKKRFGPSLNKPQRAHHCSGKMYSKDRSKILLIVAGGRDNSYPQKTIDSVEILDPTSDQGWVEGKTLNILIRYEPIDFC